MQFLASLHIVLTCSFVVLLAYLLSRVFTYLAHSFIHGSSTSRRRSEGSSRGKRRAPSTAQREREDYVGVGVMARLQEEDEEDDDERDAYQKDAAARTSQYDMAGGIFNDLQTPAAAHTSNFDMGGGIFDDVSDREYDVKRADAKRDNGEGEGLQDNGKYKTRELVYMELQEDSGRGNRKLEDADRNGSKEEMGASNSSAVLGDAQESSSMQQRLPPTWSDLQRMVNLSSNQSSLPRVSPLPED